MSPDQIGALTSLLSILDKVSGWPFGLILFAVIVGPWIMALSLGWAYRQRFEAVIRMYENNVVVVKNFEKLSGDLKEVVMMNTQCWAEATKAIENNQYCPLNRLKRMAEGPQA